ncbi:sensor domain-containing diguanylate cyclase [Clostridium ganghwense]|uniref:Sensor domain-containing diguanylate cyclase n=1 Tax=Clostridium ganghwense TaxID=312089 RepID=A0ABT4CQ16_9CLOT|nr:sensor domain-containing diguanylate cyclase [Clostridium ganghwense]MCY6371112.1 sensor domain-containing diguanylate cyclase [Clostridium ganghwense]
MSKYDADFNSQYYEEKYLKLQDEFETYQNFAESNIQIINERNAKLEKKLDAITNIVEITKYINSYLSDENLIPMINDMIIGILGATYSSIYLMEDDKLVIKATNINNKEKKFYDGEEDYKELMNGNPFIMNSKTPLFFHDSQKSEIHSLIGVSINLREKFIGYIIVEHALYNFFGHDLITFISTIANQIAIALENNALYNQIRENAIRDPLLRIYNRKYFFDLLENKIERISERTFAIVMVDLDNFKKANDLYGHQLGDKVLKETTKIIQNNIDKNDIVSRYGGEEIVIYIKYSKDIEEVYRKIDNIRSKISKNIIIYGNMQISITASFGISYYPIDGENLQDVISVADARLYVAKKTGKNKVVNK